MNNKQKITIFIVTILFTLSCGAAETFLFNGPSMEPTIIDGQKIFGEEIKLDDLKRGDIIYFSLPNTNQNIVKRLIALPGETIQIKEDGLVYVNNTLLDEPYIKEPAHDILEIITLKDNEYFVLGDNRNNSTDSRKFGLIPGDAIKGIIIQ